MTYGSAHYWASEDLNTTGENVGITLDSMCDIIAANDVTNGNAVVFVPGDIEHGEKGHFALGEGGGSAEINADENVILVGDGENWTKENVAKYMITLEASEEPEESTEENPDPEPPAIDTAVIGTATPIIKLRSGVDTEEETFNGEIAARDKGTFCIQGGAKVNIGEKAVVFEGDDRGKFWNDRLVGPEIDIGACAKIEMNGNGTTPQDNATPTISMRGNCIIDMQDGSPYDYFGYSNMWKRGYAHHCIRNDIVRNMFNFVDEFQTGPVLQMKNRSVISMTHESILQMRHAATFIMEGNANFKCTSYGSGDIQAKRSEVLFGPNTLVQIDSQDPKQLAVLQVMAGSSYNGQIMLSTALKDNETLNPATATDYSYYEFTRNGNFSNQLRAILKYRYPGTLAGASPATYQGYWFISPFKPMHVFDKAKGLLGSYEGDSEALKQSYLKDKPKCTTFVMDGNSTLNISGQSSGVVHIDKQATYNGIYVEGCHVNSGATLIKENQIEEGSYVITQFNTDSRARALFKVCPDKESDTFVGFTPSGRTSINLDPQDVCGINYQSLQTDIEAKWARFQGIFEGNDSFIQMDGNTHLESWSSTVILRNSDPYDVNSGICYPNKSGTESFGQSEYTFSPIIVPLDSAVDNDLIPFKRYVMREAGTRRFNQYWMYKTTMPTPENIILKFYSSYFAPYKGTQETIDYQQTDAQYASIDIEEYASDTEITSYEDLIVDPAFIAAYQAAGIKDIKYDADPPSSSSPYYSCTYNSSRNKYIINCYRSLKAASVGTGQNVWKGLYENMPIKNTSSYYVTYSKTDDPNRDIQGYFGNHFQYDSVYFPSSGAYGNGRIRFQEDEGFSYKASTTDVQLSMEALPVTFNLSNCTLTYYTQEDVTGKTVQELAQTDDFIYAMNTLLSFDENATYNLSNATVQYTDYIHRDINFTYLSSSSDASHFGTIKVVISNFSISNFTYLLKQIVSGSTYQLEPYSNQTITTSTVINDFCRLAGLNETMVDLSFNYSVSSCVTGQWYEKLAWQTHNPSMTNGVSYKGHLGKDWTFPIQTMDRIGSKDWDKSPIIQAQGPANVMIRESMKEALKDSGLIYIPTSTWISTKEQMYTRPEYIAFVNSINNSTDKDYGGLISFEYTQKTVSGNREWRINFYYTRKWTFTTTADEFDLTDNNAALYAFKNSSYYSAFLGDIESGYELDHIDYISQVDSTTYQIHYFAKENGTTNRVNSSGLAPVVEITDDSELRLYGGAKIKAETECGETIVTITGASNEGSVSFTIAQLKALKALIS